MTAYLNNTAKSMLAVYDSVSTVRSLPLAQQITYGQGGGNVQLPHAGIPAGLVVSFSGTLSVSNGTTAGTVTANPSWPFGVMGLSTLMDYAGVTRVYADGYRLYLRDLLVGRGYDMKNPYASEAYSPLVFTAAIPPMTASTTTTAPVNFSVYVPISLYSHSVLGSYDATVPQGTAQFVLTEAPLVGSNVTYPLTATGSAKPSLTGTWSFEYIYFDAPSNVPIPVGALSLIHEYYQQNTNTDQIVAGGTPEVVLLTGREYYRLLWDIVANNTYLMSSASPDIAKVSFLVDSSTPTIDYSFTSYLYHTRRKMNRDLPFILYDFVDKPWSPNSYGSLTARLTLSNALNPGTVTASVLTRETLYLPSGNLVNVGG